MLTRLKSALKKDKAGYSLKLPRHVVLTMDGIDMWAVKNGQSYAEAYKKSFSKLREIIGEQTKLGIPITSFYVLEESHDPESESHKPMLDELEKALNDLTKDTFIHRNKIKISVLGKWYHLPGRIVNSIKNIIEETKDYDNFFVNLCINYGGQEEIVDAVKLIAMQVKTGKLDPELVDKDLIKENLYSSYLLPPNLLVKSGSVKESTGIFLWDSPRVKMHFANKLWPDLDKTDFVHAARDYQKSRKPLEFKKEERVL